MCAAHCPPRPTAPPCGWMVEWFKRASDDDRNTYHCRWHDWNAGWRHGASSRRVVSDQNKEKATPSSPNKHAPGKGGIPFQLHAEPSSTRPSGRGLRNHFAAWERPAWRDKFLRFGVGGVTAPDEKPPPSGGGPSSGAMTDGSGIQS